MSVGEERSAATCHCGRTVEPRDPDPWEGRMDDYCCDCATNRCDCYPDECPVKYPPGRTTERDDAADLMEELGRQDLEIERLIDWNNPIYVRDMGDKLDA